MYFPVQYIFMSISTLQTIQTRPTGRNTGGKNIFFIIPAIVIAAILIFFGGNLIGAFGELGGKSAITVDVTNGRAEIFINDENLGVTPYESQEIKPGTNKVTIKSSNRKYETTIDFLSNNDKYIHKVGVFRDLGISDLFSAGQDLWFDEDTTDTVLRIISNPSGASVFIDNTEIGKTPFTSSKLSEGDYDLRVERVGFEPQKARIRIQKGYTSNISVKLFPMPVPSRVSTFDESDELYDISSDNNAILADTATWVKGVVYWNQTRGINLEGVGLNKELVFDYFLDYKGNIFNALGEAAATAEDLEELKEATRGAYMGRVSDGIGLSEAAKTALNEFKGVKIEEAEDLVEILPTGLGWLRVRSDPTTSGTEVAKVDVGKQFPLLEEGKGWVKIIVDSKTEGWISSTYAEIITAEEQVQGAMDSKVETSEDVETDGTEDTSTTL